MIGACKCGSGGPRTQTARAAVCRMSSHSVHSRPFSSQSRHFTRYCPHHRTRNRSEPTP